MPSIYKIACSGCPWSSRQTAAASAQVAPKVSDQPGRSGLGWRRSFRWSGGIGLLSVIEEGDRAWVGRGNLILQVIPVSNEPNAQILADLAKRYRQVKKDIQPVIDGLNIEHQAVK
jgi:hypothetical protein